MGSSHVRNCFVSPPSHGLALKKGAVKVPVVDLRGLRQSPRDRSCIVEDVGKACRQMGFFQIVNHGICQSVLQGALASALDFFDLPMAEKIDFMSTDVYEPVRYETIVKGGIDGVQFRRVFLKHYAHPLKGWIGLWPPKPLLYREKMGRYCIEVRKVAMEVMGAITESLGLGPLYLGDKLEAGMQVMAVNCYSPCPQTDAASGMPPHSDYSCITILLQSCPGLQIMISEDGTWRLVPELHGALQVHVGDHLEVLSNGLYKSVIHRATLNSEKTRISIASLHSLAMDEKMETAKELVDEQHPRGYIGSSFSDFLKFLSTNDIAEGKNFIDTLRIKE